VLGQAAVGGKAKTYVDWKRRLLAMGRNEARARCLPWATVMRWKSRVRAGLPIEDGHGGRALERVRAALAALGTRPSDAISAGPANESHPPTG